MVGKKIKAKKQLKEVKETVNDSETVVEEKKPYKFDIWKFLGIE